jgi:hypothetical protein
MERGEVYGIVGTELSSFRATKPDWFRDKKARIVVQIGLTKSPDIPDVPSALDLVKDEQGHKVFEVLLARQENGRPFALPPGTPPDVVATFRQAFEALVKDPAFLEDAAKLNADISPTSGEEIAQLLNKTAATPKPLLDLAIATFKKAGGRVVAAAVRSAHEPALRRQGVLIGPVSGRPQGAAPDDGDAAESRAGGCVQAPEAVP